jgi:hypothetical protein
MVLITIYYRGIYEEIHYFFGEHEFNHVSRFFHYEYFNP